MRHVIPVLILSLLMAACSASGPAVKEQEREDNYNDRVVYIQEPQSLADFLVRVPGVNVIGSTVTIRGAEHPLFIVDGVNIGHSYASAANAVSVNDIESVEVLKSPAETAIYGRQGQNGVIIITTRK